MLHSLGKKLCLARGVKCGTAFCAVHTLLVLLIFLVVQFSQDGQAGFAWFFFNKIDYPAVNIGYWAVGETHWMRSLVEFWYTIGYGQGPNIRAFIVVGLFGGLYWFLVGFALCILVFCLKYKVKNSTGSPTKIKQIYKDKWEHK